MSHSDYTDGEIRDMSKKQIRKEFPSGWMELSRYETLVLAIDALLESPAARQFTLDELSELSGAGHRSLSKRIDSLVRLGVVNKIPGEQINYTLNSDSPIVQDLYKLNSTVERVKNDNPPETEPSSYKVDEENINPPRTEETDHNHGLTASRVMN